MPLLFVLGVYACSHSPAAGGDYLEGYPALADSQLVNVVVEIPAGTNAKWEVDKNSGGMHWERKDGRSRVIQYLAYPANYGMIPRTILPSELGGDGDPLDVLLLGPRVERGSVIPARPIGVLRLVDEGERDDKILTVATSGPLSDVVDIDDLELRYPGVSLIVQTWFTNYKGPGHLTSPGFAAAAAAIAVVREASQYYEERARPTG